MAAGARYVRRFPHHPAGGRAMSSVFPILMTVLLAAVAIILALGLWNLLRGGNSSRSQSLMRMRILFQFIAVVVVMAALYIASR